MNIKLLLASSCLVIQASSTKSTSSNSRTEKQKKKSPCCFSKRFVAMTALIAAISALTLIPKDSWPTKLTNAPIEEETLNTEEYETEYVEAFDETPYKPPQSDELQEKIQKIIELEQSEEPAIVQSDNVMVKKVQIDDLMETTSYKDWKLSELSEEISWHMCEGRFQDYSEKCPNFNPIETLNKKANEISEPEETFKDGMFSHLTKVPLNNFIESFESCDWYSNEIIRGCKFLFYGTTWNFKFPETIRIMTGDYTPSESLPEHDP